MRIVVGLRDGANSFCAGHVNFLKPDERMLAEPVAASTWEDFKADYGRRLADVTVRCRKIAEYTEWAVPEPAGARLRLERALERPEQEGAGRLHPPRRKHPALTLRCELPRGQTPRNATKHYVFAAVCKYVIHADQSCSSKASVNFVTFWHFFREANDKPR